METREARYYRALYQVAKTVNSTLNPPEVMRAIAESTTQAMGAKGCSLMLLSPDRRELHHSAAYGLSDWYVRKGPVSVDLSMAEALQGRSVAVRDAAIDLRLQYRPQAVQEGIASILCVPVRRRDDVIGVMRVYTADPREFGAADVEFVEAVANLGAIALENAHRYEQAQISYNAVRQDLLEWYATWGLERSADALAGGVVDTEN